MNNISNNKKEAELARTRLHTAEAVSNETIDNLTALDLDVKSKPGKSSMEKRYQTALNSIPVPGIGAGCHAALLGVANLGIMAGLTRQQVFEDIQANVPTGDRDVSNSEIWDAVNKAASDVMLHKKSKSRLKKYLRPTPVTKAKRQIEAVKAIPDLQNRFIEAGGGELDLFSPKFIESSPVAVGPKNRGMITLLKALYQPNDKIYIGPQTSWGAEQALHIKPATEWASFFDEQISFIEAQPMERQEALWLQLEEEYAHIIPNPLTGTIGRTKGGKPTMRGDSCVNNYRFALCEFDNLPLLQQGAFWRGLKMPICAAIYSGGKSIHCWVKCDNINTADEWNTHVKKGLFPMLKALGADGACCNPSRMSRLPGIFRSDTGRYQQLLYLAPEGGLL